MADSLPEAQRHRGVCKYLMKKGKSFIGGYKAETVQTDVRWIKKCTYCTVNKEDETGIDEIFLKKPSPSTDVYSLV
jgi:hypothetical protein